MNGYIEIIATRRLIGRVEIKRHYCESVQCAMNFIKEYLLDGCDIEIRTIPKTEIILDKKP